MLGGISVPVHFFAFRIVSLRDHMTSSSEGVTHGRNTLLGIFPLQTGTVSHAFH